MPARRQTHPQTLALLRSRAADMRAHPTFSELALWSELSGSKLGVAFRRQVVLPPFIADFVAPRAMVIVEVDGGYHDRRTPADERRDSHLRRRGYRILRFSEELVLRDRPEALRRIRAVLAQ